MPILETSIVDILKNRKLTSNFTTEKRTKIQQHISALAQRDLEIESWDVDMAERCFAAVFVNGGNRLTFKYSIDRGMSISTIQETPGFFDWLVNF
jgi:hypothetical protein